MLDWPSQSPQLNQVKDQREDFKKYAYRCSPSSQNVLALFLERRLVKNFRSILFSFISACRLAATIKALKSVNTWNWNSNPHPVAQKCIWVILFKCCILVLLLHKYLLLYDESLHQIMVKIHPICDCDIKSLMGVAAMSSKYIYLLSSFIWSRSPLMCYRIFVVGVGFFSLCFLMTSLGGQFSAKRLGDSPFTTRAEGKSHISAAW